MGPPPFGDGKRTPTWSCPWCGPRFNGAIAFRRWKGHSDRLVRMFQSLLQWGHRLSAMERGYGAVDDADADAASMGPPPFGDGKRFTEQTPPR